MLFNFAVQTIEAAFDGYPVSWLTKQTEAIFSRFSHIQMVETSLLLFCILFDNIANNQKKITRLATLIETYFDRLIVLEGDLIQSRILLVLNTYLCVLFHDKRHLLTLITTNYILPCFLQSESKIKIVFSAECLNNILEQENLTAEISPYLKDSLKLIISNIETLVNGSFFIFVMKIVTFVDVIEFFPELVTELIKRFIKLAMAETVADNKKEINFINLKILAILELTVSSERYLNTFYVLF